MSLNWFSSIAVSLGDSRKSGDQGKDGFGLNLPNQTYVLLTDDLRSVSEWECVKFVKTSLTFNKGNLIRLEQFSTKEKIVEDDFYFGSIQVELFNKRSPHLRPFFQSLLDARSLV